MPKIEKAGVYEEYLVVKWEVAGGGISNYKSHTTKIPLYDFHKDMSESDIWDTIWECIEEDFKNVVGFELEEDVNMDELYNAIQKYYQDG